MGIGGTLLQRYLRVWLDQWRIRSQITRDAFERDEAEFLPAALALQAKPVSPLARQVALILVCLVVTALLWTLLGKLDVSVTAQGKVVPSTRTKTIASVDTASVRAIYVTEGQEVVQGDVLIELDSSASTAERDKALAAVEAARLQVARSRALLRSVDTGRTPVLDRSEGVTDEMLRSEQDHLLGQFNEFMSKLRVVDGEIRHYEDALPLALERERDYEELVKDRDVSVHAWLDKKQSRLDLQSQLRDARSRRAALLDETKRAAYDAVADGERQLAIAEQDAMRAATHASLLSLRSPVDGTVQQLNIHTVGGVVGAAQPLMTIVPKGEPVEVEAFLEDKDIGFVRDGQEAQIKVQAYEFTKYGTIPGKVVHLSRDAISDEKRGLLYAARVVPDRSSILVDGRWMPIIDGMAVSVEVRTGTRRVIDYVLDPILRHRDESLHER